MTRSGVLVVDKPQGLSSFQVVAAVRRAFGQKSVGHAGTLDPMATGVLVVMLGEATKLSKYLTLESKGYIAEICFGRSTDTLDAFGEVQAEQTLADNWLDADALNDALHAERQRTEQVPPSVSAIKVQGRRAYALARKGAPPNLPPRPVQVEHLNLTSFTQHSAHINLLVSKGYYVRSLARDLGTALGVPSHLCSLRRTQSGDFTLTEAVPWPLTGNEPLQSLHSVARRCLPTVTLTETGHTKALLGQLLQADNFNGSPSKDHTAAWLAPSQSELVAVGEWSEEKQGYRVRRGFNPPSPPCD